MFHHVRDWFQRKSPRNDPFLVPLELVFSDVLQGGPPEKVFSEDRFRVGVYRELCRTTQKTPAVFWLDLQFRNKRKRKWESMVCMHDSRLEIMLRVLGDAVAYTQQQKKQPS